MNKRFNVQKTFKNVRDNFRTWWDGFKYKKLNFHNLKLVLKNKISKVIIFLKEVILNLNEKKTISWFKKDSVTDAFLQGLRIF